MSVVKFYTDLICTFMGEPSLKRKTKKSKKQKKESASTAWTSQIAQWYFGQCEVSQWSSLMGNMTKKIRAFEVKCWCGICLVPLAVTSANSDPALNFCDPAHPSDSPVRVPPCLCQWCCYQVHTPVPAGCNLLQLFMWFFSHRTHSPNFFPQHMPNLHHQHCDLLLNICWCNSAEDLAFKFYPIHLKIIKLLLCISQKWEPSLGGICINYVSILRNAFWASPSIHFDSWASDWSHWEWSARLLSGSDPASQFWEWNYLSLSAPIKPSALVLPTSAECQAVLCAINACN